jgi:hypothetical protein
MVGKPDVIIGRVTGELLFRPFFSGSQLNVTMLRWAENGRIGFSVGTGFPIARRSRTNAARPSSPVAVKGKVAGSGTTGNPLSFTMKTSS